MNNKRFLIIRIIIIVLTIISLVVIEYYQRELIEQEQKIIEEQKNMVTEELVKDAAKLYITNNQDYYAELIKEKLEIRINTNDLVKAKLIDNNDDFKGYVKVFNDEFIFVKTKNMLVEAISEKDHESNSNNEHDPYDIKYYYKGNTPKNYIKYNGKLYRIIGVTNSNDLKVISVDNNIIEKWGLSGNINYLKTDVKEIEDGYKGLFYVGYVRSETKDISSIIKNEKRNNTYTVSNPKYIGLYSYVSISDIVNASSDCKYDNVLGIKKDNCNSYLINMLNNTFTSISLEDNQVYKINDKGELIASKLETNINIKKVIYISGYNEYLSGNGTEQNPYEIK